MNSLPPSLSFSLSLGRNEKSLPCTDGTDNRDPQKANKLNGGENVDDFKLNNMIT